MKKLLSLLALIAATGAASAYAENQGGAAPAAQPVAPAAPAAKPAGAKVVIALMGQPESVAALAAELEKDAAYKNAACALPRKPGKGATMVCANGDSALMALLLHSNAGKVRWTISGTAAPKAMAVQSSGTATFSTLSTTSTTCQKQTCSNVTACFLPKCGAACTGSC